MNEDAISIVVDEADKRNILNAYDKWRRLTTGDTIIFLPYESAGLYDGGSYPQWDSKRFFENTKRKGYYLQGNLKTYPHKCRHTRLIGKLRLNAHPA